MFFSVKPQIVRSVSVNLLCDLWQRLCINNNPAPFSCAAICHPHKEQQQQFAISSQKGTLLSAHSPVRIRDESHHTNWHCDFQFVREAGWFCIPQRLDVSLLSFIKNKSQIRASHPLYYRAYTEHLPWPSLFSSTCAWVHVSATPHHMGREHLKALWTVEGFIHVCAILQFEALQNLFLIFR